MPPKLWPATLMRGADAVRLLVVAAWLLLTTPASAQLPSSVVRKPCWRRLSMIAAAASTLLGGEYVRLGGVVEEMDVEGDEESVARVLQHEIERGRGKVHLVLAGHRDVGAASVGIAQHGGLSETRGVGPPVAASHHITPSEAELRHDPARAPCPQAVPSWDSTIGWRHLDSR